MAEPSRTVIAGQHHIQDNGIESFTFVDEPLQSRFAVGGDLDGVPFCLQVEAQAIGQMRLVLNDNDAAHATVSFCGNSFLGNSRVTVVPLPAPSLSANTRPPCLRAIDRTMNNPRPVPLTCESERCVTR